jgi:hypothetical protein
MRVDYKEVLLTQARVAAACVQCNPRGSPSGFAALLQCADRAESNTIH